MNFVMHEMGPPLTQERITILERELGIVLPDDYKAFLLQFNGGRPDPGDFPIRGLESNPFGRIRLFPRVDGVIESSNLDLSYNIYAGRIPMNFIPIARTGTGDLICLSLRGRDQGCVYFWDHEEEHIPPSYENMYFVAPTFPDFLSSIHFEQMSAEVAKALKGAIVIKRPQ